jgi:phage shock protein A
MPAEVENLLLEHLKRFQAGQDRIEHKLGELVTRVGQLEVSLAGLRTDVGHVHETSAGMSVRLDRLSERLERIERRLDLRVDA